jgi:hypothetical protein
LTFFEEYKALSTIIYTSLLHEKSPVPEKENKGFKT